MSNDNRAKLRILLNYWVEHNQEHGQEFREWVEKARKMGEGKVADEILQAVGHMEKVSEIFAKTLKRLEEV